MTAEMEISNRSYRAAEFRSATLDADKRTVEIVWSSGAAVRRYDWSRGEFYFELLEMTPEACDLSRMNSGAVSFLDNHRRESMSDRLGSIVPGTARLEAGLGIATVKLSTSAAGSRILADLEAGLSLPTSVGYSISAYSREEGDDDALPTVTATRWMPLEISAALIPADAAAMARSEPPGGSRTTVPVTVINRRAKGAAEHQERNMTTTTDDGRSRTQASCRHQRDRHQSQGERRPDQTRHRRRHKRHRVPWNGDGRDASPPRAN